MYESPISVYYTDIKTKFENQLMEAMIGVGLDVDKEELLKALNYDREQYQKGYKDGRGSLVRCRDCIIKKAVPHRDGIAWRCPHRTGDVKMEGFCESGVRADEDLGTS